MDSATLLPFDTLALWIGFFFSLMIFSALAGDNGLARFAQHVFVGASLGYVAILASQHILRPRLLAPLLSDEIGNPLLWIPLGLGMLLFVASLDRILHQSTRPRGSIPRWRALLHGAGRIPVALLVGIGVGVGIVGTLQGTLIPQYWRAAQIGFAPSPAGGQFLTGVLTLLITTAALLYFYVSPEQYLEDQPTYVRRLMLGWVWLGQRAVWLAAGIIFARLAAARLSLLIARLEILATTVTTSPLWDWLMDIFQNG